MERLFENLGSKEDLQRHLEPKAASVNVLTHAGLWPTTIKLNSS